MGMVTGGPGAVTLVPADRVAALAAVKARLRVETTIDDALIAAFAETALGLAEQFLGSALIVREMVATLPACAAWQLLPARPVRAIVPAVAAGAGVSVDIDADGLGWVRMAAGAPLDVTFSAGLASGWDTLPPALRQGVAMLAAHLFTDRGGTTPVPAAVTALWRPFRVVRMTREIRA